MRVAVLQHAYDLQRQAHALFEAGRGTLEGLRLRDLSESALAEDGDVVWEATLLSAVAGPGRPVSLDLPPLNEGFKLEVMCDDPAGDFSRFSPGDRVRIIGRFGKSTANTVNPSAVKGAKPDSPSTIWIAVRFPADQPAPSGDSR